jgi:FlaA1/EpsC-like NDP-sugar epimerase
MISYFVPQILNLPRTSKRLVALALDVFLCLATVVFAYWLRVGAFIYPMGWQWLSYACALAMALPLFVTSGLYRAIFRYAAWGALRTIARACGIYGLAYCMIFTVVGVPGVPRSLGVLQPILLFLAIGSSRAWVHYWLGGAYQKLFKEHKRHRVLIYGAGSAGRQLAAGLANSMDMEAVAFVDDDKTLNGSVLNGRRIYPAKNLRDLIERLQIDDVLLAIPSTSRQRRNEIIDELRTTSATIRTLPGINDLAHGRVTVNDLRELDIEDLLGRDTVPPNQLLLARNIHGKVVLVTGAGGSIGSELCRQILALGPERLILVDHSEFNLYSIDQDLQQLSADIDDKAKILSFLGSVKDAARMDGIMGRWKPHTVYHAAAYKHVPLVENNPAEGVRNNVFGTRIMVELSEKHGVSDFVLISTDKAVRPTNVMGATKRLAEMILQARAAEKPMPRFSMVRFGNVLGSSGSVIPLFRKQIASGGPVTVTHEEITRYFMTIPEAAQLVIQAGAMAQGGEVFVLDMGEPVKILDLARRMIELSGLIVRDEKCPDGDIEIKIVGLRPAEKLYEELLIGDNPERTSHPRIMKAQDGHPTADALQLALSDFPHAIESNQDVLLRQKLRNIVPEYTDTLEFSASKIAS